MATQGEPMLVLDENGNRVHEIHAVLHDRESDVAFSVLCANLKVIH